MFEENTKEVKRTIHEHRLLVHDAREGWEPLCKFLNKPVPETPYPLTNETSEMKKQARLLKRMGAVPWLLVVAIVVYLVV